MKDVLDKTTTGSYNWGIASGGSLTLYSKISLAMKAIGMRIKKRFSATGIPHDVEPEDMVLPDSKLVKRTLEFIGDVHELPLKNHSLRVVVIGQIFGRAEKLNFDPEVYAIASLLHDIGLEDQFCCMHPGIDCFAVEGAKEAGLFLEGLDMEVSCDKVDLVRNAISFHLNLQIPDPLKEAYLLNKASGTDTIGFYRDELSDSAAASINKAFPRHNFNRAVHEKLKKQAKMRPHSRMAFLYQNGFGKMLLEERF